MSEQDVHVNPDLRVGEDNKQRWNQPARRRHGFHNAHKLMRRMHMVRSRHVMELIDDPQDLVNCVEGLNDLISHPAFSALICVQGNRVVFERCASDFSVLQPHSIQSVTKLHIHLIVGRLVAQGLLDLEQPVSHYLPEIGAGYADAPVQRLLDMAIDNDFSEDYSDPLSDCYAEEIALGWRLPEDGVAEISLSEFASRISGYRPETAMETIQYKSANTDVLTLICHKVCPHDLKVEIEAIADAAGYEGAFHISLSPDQMPAFSGGGCLSARDLARFGLLFARKGLDVHGKPFANQAFLNATLGRAALPMSPPKDWLKYSNHTMTNGQLLGHAGYGGQFLLVDCENEISCAFQSVLENEAGYDDDYMADVVLALSKLCEAISR
ncbi:CubicO group peptidase, beta-lactamase class C family [Shimia gijangensis]|uniref:CubicO group peptidase, beta-lactamase class C family n=1 Tax=Shimia gijangensis TaxID=1470563 RepID=A0A1M6CC13_9RHOB|nr:serine hydrolase domain-containing protein [Shimia gijangensis]SHI58268.1 CubicO group peptidase, beta-lactamase class C family [Shimia gijangensis]